MEITLAPESASRIRAVLGDSVDLSPAAVPHALARLAEEAPDVYSHVLDELSGSDIRLDSERALHRRHRRSALRRALFGWGEYESDAGDRLVAKRRVAAAVPIGLAAVLLAAAGLSAVLNRAHPAPSASTAVGAHGPSRGSPHGEAEPVRRAAVRETPAWSREVSGRLAMAARAAPLSADPPDSTGLPRGRPAPPPLPPVPAFPALSPLPGRHTGDGPPPPIVFNRTQPADTAPHSLIAYARDTPADTGAVSSGEDRTAAPRTSSAEERDGTGAIAARRAGDRVAARLTTGIVVAAGVPAVPVVAEGTDGSIWLGHAAAEADGRVHITFQTARDAPPAPSPAAPARAGTTARGVALGVALDPDQLAAGLPARIVTRRRAAAAAAIGAVAQAAADYVQALSRAGQISITDGAAQITVGGPAPGWTYAASRLADTLNPQAPGTIQTLEVPAGARCVILITEAP